MHKKVHELIREVKEEMPYMFRFRKVLEVGSHAINGSPRQHFSFCDYTGIDISKGKGVDIVGRLIDVYLQDNQYDVVVSTEMLEHDETWAKSLDIMYRRLHNGGLMIITCASVDRKEHGTRRTTPHCSPDTPDYYRNISIEDFKSILPPELFEEYVLQYARGKNDLQFYGIKKGEKPKRTYKNILEAIMGWVR